MPLSVFARTYRIPETALLTGAMEKTLNNILSLVNGPSEEMRTVSLWGRCEQVRLVMEINPYIGIMAGIVQRVELTATSVSKNSPIIFIYNIITEHCIIQCTLCFLAQPLLR